MRPRSRARHWRRTNSIIGSPLRTSASVNGRPVRSVWAACATDARPRPAYVAKSWHEAQDPASNAQGIGSYPFGTSLSAAELMQ